MLPDFVAGRDARSDRTEVHDWRAAVRQEVDFVVESGGHLMPVEVSATSCPRLVDAASFSLLRAEYGEHARAGLLLHTGKTREWLAPGILAAPWWRVLVVRAASGAGSRPSGTGSLAHGKLGASPCRVRCLRASSPPENISRLRMMGPAPRDPASGRR